jgi:hypothetical protein
MWLASVVWTSEAQSRKFDGRYAGNMPNDLTPIRAYLLAWADDGAPVCAAAR